MELTDEITANMRVLMIFKLKDMTPSLQIEKWGNFNNTHDKIQNFTYLYIFF